MLKSHSHTGHCRQAVGHNVAQHLRMAACLRCVSKHRCSHHKATGLQGLFKWYLVIDSHWLSALTERLSNLICWKMKKAGIAMVGGWGKARLVDGMSATEEKIFFFYCKNMSLSCRQITLLLRNQHLDMIKSDHKSIFCLFFKCLEAHKCSFCNQCWESVLFQWTYRVLSPGCYYTYFLTGNTRPAPLTLLTSALK